MHDVRDVAEVDLAAPVDLEIASTKCSSEISASETPLGAAYLNVETP